MHELRAKSSAKPQKTSVLLIGAGFSNLRIANALREIGYQVKLAIDGNLDDIPDTDVVLSFGLRHKITTKILESARNPLVNAHMSLLPHNRGAHPNFWSFYDETPKGVSLHLMDKGIDTGPVIAQKEVFFDSSKLTFRDTYAILHNELETLLLERFEDVSLLRYHAEVQVGEGSYHKASDLPEDFRGWDENIALEIKRLGRKG